MDKIGTELRKLLMAGIGAVSTTVEKSQEIIGKLAEKGELTYEQAKALSQDVAEKVKNAVDESGVKDMFTPKSRKDTVIGDLDDLTDEELAAVREAADAIEKRRRDADACCEQVNPDCPCEGGACDCKRGDDDGEGGACACGDAECSGCPGCEGKEGE